MSTQRLAELRLLVSAFPGQLTADHPDVQLIIDDDSASDQSPDEWTGHFTIDKQAIITWRLPSDYPQSPPDVRVRVVDGRLNNDVQRRIDSLVTESAPDDLVSLVLHGKDVWERLRDELGPELNGPSKGLTQQDQPKPIDQPIDRLWIYSHHIKASEKRKLIIEEAETRGLTGFMLSGKPGIICVEGPRDQTELFWVTVHGLNWQRISLVETESACDRRRFEGFQEVVDKSWLFKELERRGCDDMLRKLLGL